MGCSECAQRPPAPQKALGRLWGCTHTHTHKGRCRKSQMPSQYHSRRSTRRALLGGLGAQGCSTSRRRLLGHRHCHFHAWGIPGTSRAGLWPRGSGFHKQRNPDVSQETSSSLCPTAGHPTLWKRFPRGQRRAAGPSQGKSQQLLPSKGCFPALLVAVLPWCWWGDPSECLVFPVCPWQSSVCSVPAALLCWYRWHPNLPN